MPMDCGQELVSITEAAWDMMTPALRDFLCYLWLSRWQQVGDVGWGLWGVGGGGSKSSDEAGAPPLHRAAVCPAVTITWRQACAGWQITGDSCG